MGVSYQNLLDLSDYISNGGSGSTYEHKYADRSNNNHATTIVPGDVDALLNALASNEDDSNWSWVGNNCSYTSKPCVDGVKIISDFGSGSYSKCNYDNKPDDSYIIENKGKPYDCPPASRCGSDVGYYWKVKSELATNYNNETGYTSNYKEIAFPGRCEKRYLGNRDGSETTTNSADTFKSGSASDNGVYNCMTYGELIKNTKYPAYQDKNDNWVTNDENDYKITNDSGAYDINKECANNSIYYGGKWVEGEMNDGYQDSKGMTIPGDPTLGYFGGGSGKVSGQTRNCAINRLQSKYVWKGEYETKDIISECEPEYPLYPGSNAENMDVPSNNAAQWWNDNSCIWVHLLNTQGEKVAGDGTVYFEPAILNGQCTFGDFTKPDPNGWLYTKEVFGSNGIGSNGIDENNPPKIFGHSFTHDELVSKIKYGSSMQLGDIMPDYKAPKDPSLPHEKRCSWVPNDDTIQTGGGNDLVPNVPDVSDSFNAQDITGKIKKYSKDTSTKPYSHPYTMGSNNIVLDKNDYRAHGYFGDSDKDTMASDCPNLNNQPNPFNFNTQSTDIKWLSGSDVNKINEGSNLISNDSGIKKINLEDSELTDNDGAGSGECWQEVRLSNVPNYVQYKAPIQGDTNPLFVDEQIGLSNPQISQTDQSSLNIQNELLLNHIPSYGPNEELIYKNMALMNDGDSVFFKRNPQDCAAADNDVVADSLGSLQYEWIQQNGSS